MPSAARVADPVSHALPPVLTGGPGSPNVSIGGMPAWRALPSALGAAIEAASQAMDTLMGATLLTPIDAELVLAEIKKKFQRVSAEAAARNLPGTAVTAAGALATLDIANDTLATTWTTASAAPGGQPAANEAYALGLQTAAAAAAAVIFGTFAGTFDAHGCCVPIPHGVGFVTVGSASVSANHLPLARQGDSVMEAAGGANAIVAGCVTVSVGD